MACTYQVESDVYGTYDVLLDEAAGVRVRIRRVGAEMVSLARLGADGLWRGFLYRDNETGPAAAGWSNHATVMGYFLHRLVDQRSDYEGEEIVSGNHGFLRAFEFDAPVFDPNTRSLTFAVEPAKIPKSAYPRALALRLSYALTADGVSVRFHFENEEVSRPAHVSFGLHPGFAVSSVANAELILPVGEYVRHLAPGNFLDGRVESVVVGGGPMPFDKSKLIDSYLLGLERLEDRRILLRDAVAGREVALDFSEVPFLTLWSGDSGFLCVEPCWGLPDSIPQKPFQDKDGIHVIPPDGTLTAGFSISCRIL